MRVLFTCGREPQYPRNIILRGCLANNNDVQDAVDSTRRLPIRFARIGLKLLVPRPPYEVACVGFLGQPLMPLVRLRTRHPISSTRSCPFTTRCALIACAFTPRSLPGRAAYWLDLLSCQLADHILLDTTPTSSISTERSPCQGENDTPLRRLRRATLRTTPLATGRLRAVLRFLPAPARDRRNHPSCQTPRIRGYRFQAHRSGHQYKSQRRLADELDVRNIEFLLAAAPAKALPDQMAGAAVCLGGHLGARSKAATG